MNFFQRAKAKFATGSGSENKVNKISKTTRTIGALLAVFGVLSISLISPNVQSAQSSTSNPAPRFNFLQGDQEMLRASVVSSGNNWSDPINAQAGDTVAFLVYYHNGVLNSVAHNTRVRVDLPTGESNVLKETSSLWSDETPVINDTIVDGHIVGLSGETVNLPSVGRIEYVAGSTKLYPEMKSHPGQPGQPLPDGITTASGVNIGNIQGCWDFAGFVTFLGKIKGNVALDINKTVKHQSDTTWSKEIAAEPNESISYKLEIKNSGDITANGISVKDILPLHMKYIAGTTVLKDSAHSAGITLPDTIFASGVSLPNLKPGDAEKMTITYRVQIDSVVPVGTLTLDNLAKLFMNGVQKDQDKARVTVTTSQGLTISKQVLSGTEWVELNNVSLGDKINYRIIIRATGNTGVTNVRVKDILPIFVNYIPGSTRINNVVAQDGIANGGISLGNMVAGQTIVVKLSGIIVGCPPIGDYTLTNTAFTSADNVTEISDIARSILRLMPTPTPTPAVKI